MPPVFTLLADDPSPPHHLLMYTAAIACDVARSPKYDDLPRCFGKNNICKQRLMMMRQDLDKYDIEEWSQDYDARLLSFMRRLFLRKTIFLSSSSSSVVSRLFQWFLNFRGSA